MTTGPLDPYEAADAPLRAEEERLSRALEDLRASRKTIAAARARMGPYLPAPVGKEPPSIAATPVTTTAQKFSGKGLGEGAVVQLAENRGMELTVKQLWSAMSAAGFHILSERPEAALSWALRKREAKHGDVILIGDGKWGLAEWYSPAQIKRFKDSRTNASGRNHIEHIENTKAGIANALSNRLTQWGRRHSITAEQMAKAYYARKSGAANSKLATSKAGKMVFPTFCSYWKQFEMENWKPGEAFPPPRRAIEKRNQDIKIEDMWPPDEEQTDLLKGNGTAVVSTVPH